MADNASGFSAVRRWFVDAGDDDAAWEEFRGRFHEAFADLWVERPLLDGVPLLHLKNFFISPRSEEQGPTNIVAKIVIEAYRRKDTARRVSRLSPAAADLRG